MKQIILVSDSHSKTYTLKEIVNMYPNAIAYLHLGDSEDYEQNLYPFISIKGNNDYYIENEYRIIKIEFLKIYMTHGHRMYLSDENMVAKAKANDCNVFAYGHTHRPYYKNIDDVHLINPGAISYPRNIMGPSIAIITLKENQKIDVEFKLI